MKQHNEYSHASYSEWKHGLFSYTQLAFLDVSPSEIELFWILDGSAWPDLPQLLRGFGAASNAWPLYLNTYLEEVRNSGPWLISCKPGMALNDWVLEQLEFNPLGLLVYIEKYSNFIMFDHFQRLLECVLPNGKQGLFRYYDPRVLFGINTFEDGQYIRQVCGPALAIETWEPGRCLPIRITQAIKDDYYTGIQALPQPLLNHLAIQTRMHTVINTLGGVTGTALRSHPLPEAYAFVQSISNFFEGSLYQTNSDLAFAVAYSLLASDDKWEGTIEEKILKSSSKYSSLEQAFKAVFPA